MSYQLLLAEPIEQMPRTVFRDTDFGSGATAIADAAVVVPLGTAVPALADVNQDRQRAGRRDPPTPIEQHELRQQDKALNCRMVHLTALAAHAVRSNGRRSSRLTPSAIMYPGDAMRGGFSGTPPAIGFPTASPLHVIGRA